MPTSAAKDARETGAKIDLTVVIVSWNTCGLLRDCLTSLFAGGGLSGIDAVEVRVVDNASTDDSAAMVREAFPTVHLTVSRENLGFARGNNRAIREATPSRYLLLLNPDTLVPPGALAALMAALDAHPAAAVASPLLLNADGSPQFCWARFPGLRSELRGKLDLTQSPYPLADFGDVQKRAGMKPFVADWVGGACFLVRAPLVEWIGPLDEAFFMYSEETDWCRRFRQIGATTLLVPTVTVTHLGGQSSRRVPVVTRQRMYQSSARLYHLLYGTVGGFLPTAVAAARYHLFRWKHRRLSAASADAPSATVSKAAATDQ